MRYINALFHMNVYHEGRKQYQVNDLYSSVLSPVMRMAPLGGDRYHSLGNLSRRSLP